MAYHRVSILPDCNIGFPGYYLSVITEKQIIDMNHKFTRAIIEKFGIAHHMVKIETYSPRNLKAGEVEIEMQYAPVNPSDIITISGAYQQRTPLPIIPGFEGVGLISKIASDVTFLNIGDRVMPIRQSGTWQDIHIVPALNCFKIDPDLNIEEAATSYINPMTAIKMVDDCSAIKANTPVLVNAANSDIGHIIISLLILIGANVTALVRTIGSRDELITRFGERINIVIEQDFNPSIYDHCYDVFFDAVGGPQAETLVSTLKTNGIIIHYGLLSGVAIKPDFAALRPDVTLKLYWLRNWIHHASRQDIEKMFQQTAQLFHDKLIKTRISECFSLKDITKALKAHANNERVGKILLKLN